MSCLLTLVTSSSNVFLLTLPRGKLFIMLREDYDKLINSIWDDRHHVEELNKELIKEFLLGQLVV